MSGEATPRILAGHHLPSPAGLARAVIVAALFSGLPSGLHAVATRRSLLASTRAAGTLLGRPTVTRGVTAHVVLSTAWTAVIAAVLPRHRPVAWGAVVGLAIGALDLSIACRRFPAIERLPVAPQLADHVAFGALAAASLSRQPRRTTVE